MKIHSLKSSFRFFTEFFCDEEWPRTFKGDVPLMKWLESYEITIQVETDETVRCSEIRILISRERLYTLYKRWVRDGSFGRELRKTTFMKDAMILGCVAKPRNKNMFNHANRRSMILLNSRVIKTAMLEKIPGFPFAEWATDYNEGRTVILKVMKGVFDLAEGREFTRWIPRQDGYS